MLELPKAAPGFDDPIGLLRACHARISERLDLLERLPEYLDTHGPDASAQAAARRVLDYFDKAAAHHHEDEEHDLFPLLRGAAGRPGWQAELPAVLDRLAAEHGTLAQDWARLRPELDALARGESAADLRCEAVIAAYRQHMALENERVFPFAEQLLSARERAALGASMQARRGIAPAPE
ncbi:Hemerythrin HHE cation binding domain protein [Thioalkalivibrio nitratireducens DSM 14787]|uniref:Hemerythrin HHE cation binding domain protein n=1 Tax=Thioalkalivibrio nitratireducens (strain DSM 14787 / UNIQEM 213 / ALEN2) TaxID=1255043 RepID=L0DWV9_THIND|nr:hemerythrin domain-containing protein [Thioalkalivibrio nitratireducens]AGA33440.1 Hemerythrin HHE cation binding domain protein [Thioalkalivibrio nitratireducens DSM 14787]